MTQAKKSQGSEALTALVRRYGGPSVAALLETGEPSVSHWMHGKVLPRAEIIYRIERRLGIAMGAWFRAPVDALRARRQADAQREARKQR